MNLKELFLNWKNKVPTESEARSSLVAAIREAAKCSDSEAERMVDGGMLTEANIDGQVESLRLSIEGIEFAKNADAGNKSTSTFKRK